MSVTVTTEIPCDLFEKHGAESVPKVMYLVNVISD